MSSTRKAVKTFAAIGTGTPSAGGATTFAVSGAMSADIIGPTTNIADWDQVCYQVTWTSANAVGVISVQGSVDNINFNDLTFTPTLAQPASNNGTYLINLALIPFPYIRVKYTRGSGTGTLTVYLSGKGT